MKTKLLLALLAITTLSRATDQIRFDKLWYDGNAEISTYSLKESRYGEIRSGTRVMIFVTEPMRLKTHIKPDAKLPENEMIRVIKLNDLRKFTTGIYEYSVMSSVFAAVETKKPYDNRATMKISFSSQEWCGQVFERIIRTPQSYTGSLMSYFESEGESQYSFDAAGVETEENLWLQIRELNGPYIMEGETKKLRLLPSRWIIRKSHLPSIIVDATISRGRPVLRQSPLGNIAVTPVVWTIENASTTVYIEHAYPHRIVEFSERDGSSGTLMVTKRVPYWKQNSNAFSELRKELRLDP